MMGIDIHGVFIMQYDQEFEVKTKETFDFDKARAICEKIERKIGDRGRSAMRFDELDERRFRIHVVAADDATATLWKTFLQDLTGPDDAALDC